MTQKYSTNIIIWLRKCQIQFILRNKQSLFISVYRQICISQLHHNKASALIISSLKTNKTLRRGGVLIGKN